MAGGAGPSGPPASGPETPDERQRRARRKRKRNGFLNHLLAYFGVLVVITPINAWLTPHEPWFLLVMVGWGAPLAVHAAYAMELFGGSDR